jgi:3-hydroxyacyl-CoA dehydrogenase/enoyl-CoA hydratase/3-hydroxybutyryl-CoA epimerase
MIDYELDAEGIATLTWDMPGRSQNVINGESCAALFAAIDLATKDESVKAILMKSGKPDFIAGGDLDWLLAVDRADELFEHVLALHRALRRLETCGKPVAAAICGTALGGGLEIALACHYRVASDNPDARYGLPEVTLGVLPGGGGTQRLPRLIGIQNSLPLLLEGRKLGAADARKLGILSAVVPAGSEVQAARDWLLAQSMPVQQPWDARGYSVPGGGVSSPAIQQLLMVSNAMLRAKTYGNCPAPANILSCVYEGLITDIETGLKTEARYFVNTVLGAEARNMIRSLFFSMNAANKLAQRPAGVPVRTYARVGILGAGMMGAGIAYVTARAGMVAVLLDTSIEAAERGKSHARTLVARQVASGRLAQGKADALLGRIVPTTDYAELAGAGLAIEAVFEDRAVKADVTRRSEAVMAADAVFASNTSTLPITGLAQASARPGNFIGMHFFSPVDRMPLIEVIVGKRTSDETLAHALDYVRAVGMTPIVVNDSRGFYTSRVFSTYVLEGLAMLAEGVAPALIENAGLQAGMPVGPLAVTDEVTAELIVKIDRQTRADLGAAYRERPGQQVARRLAELGRIGRKAGQGFYEYPQEGSKYLWPGLAAQFPVATRQPAICDLVRRLIAVQSVEAALCMQEGVLRSARDADVGAILGWGYPPWRGGTIGQIHSTGLGRFIAECEQLSAQHGDRFNPPQLLKDMVARGEAFYAR